MRLFRGLFALLAGTVFAIGVTPRYLTSTGGIMTGDLILARHVRVKDLAPTIVSCGTTPSIIGSDTAGRITAGGGAAFNICTITFAIPWENPPMCFSDMPDQPPPSINAINAQATITGITFESSTSQSMNGLHIEYFCIGRRT